MNEKEKITFVKELTNSVVVDIIKDIQSKRIPDDWDGIELRMLLADRFLRCVHAPDRSRKREYNNTVIVNNL